MDKVIHYCWFGGNPLPELAQKCIASWKKHCPDYQIREWNETNFDLDCCDYVREAYQQKKWAFVSDYARFKILYQYGGLYFDTDVELIKPIDDIIQAGPFMGIEKNAKRNMVAAGLGLCAEPEMPIYKEILDHYEGSHFVENGKINYYSVVDRITDILTKYGLEDRDALQTVAELTLYPSCYFCPLNYETNDLEITEDTRSIHWYDASWLNDRMKTRQKRCAAIRKKIPGNMGEFLCKCYVKLSYLWEWIQTGQLLRKITDRFKGE